MRIIFVRHGHPDYEKDCLTELGHKQAIAAAQRLKDEKIDRVFSSSCGRAAETAEHIAKLHNKEVILCDFMQEIGWGHIDGEPIEHNGHPWTVASKMVADGQNIMSENWADEEPFLKNKFKVNALRLAGDLDKWLSELGYEREGKYYRVKKSNTENVVMACHGGSSAAALSHLFNLPVPFVCRSIAFGYTGIHIVKLSEKEGELVSPSFKLVNDVRHIAGFEIENVFGI